MLWVQQHAEGRRLWEPGRVTSPAIASTGSRGESGWTKGGFFHFAYARSRYLWDRNRDKAIMGSVSGVLDKNEEQKVLSIHGEMGRTHIFQDQ